MVIVNTERKQGFGDFPNKLNLLKSNSISKKIRVPSIKWFCQASSADSSASSDGLIS